ncbi:MULTISPECIES: hypothetical protein [unclassified Mycobacterium]|uniref:hypothetical protein n=1 Tax=unclassified Mycobacterium TaxID=2642494 RepID=UPI000801CF78|nr:MULTISPECIES: hypothetical protein [unclassified Mycobacterium]OBG71328.1 hypothetical protein A5700_12210 [Mycobacterium sp. E1214]OBH28696.1 hypothetical protein A5693_21525 [Mycobacterium sp. E1319]
MTLPDSGANWATALEPSLNPLAVRYWQITDVLIRDYLKADGTVFNLTDPAVGLGSAGLFTPFAADGTIREDLLITASGDNQGFYHIGELKEDTTSITPDETVQETPTAQSVRTVRNVLTKLGDKIAFTPVEATPLVDYLRYELPLQNVPDVGTAGYQVSRPPFDMLQERIIVLLGVDTDGQLRAEVFPRVVTDRKGKTDLQRKNPESLELTYSALVDPYSQAVSWICREGIAWRALGGAPTFSTTAPVATAVAGGKATVSVAEPTGFDVTDAQYTVAQQEGGSGSYTAATLASGTNPTGRGTGTLTFTVQGLTAADTYKFQVTATGSNDATSTTQPSNSITALS